MRPFALFWLVACAGAPQSHTTAAVADPVEETPPTADPEPEPREAPPEIMAPALSAQELIEQAGVATFIEDRDLRIAAIDDDAMERWFVRKPTGVFLYTERPIEVAEPGVMVRGTCQRVTRYDSVVLNEYAVVVWRRGQYRTVVELGQESVDVADQTRERGEWVTNGVRRLPMSITTWEHGYIRYTEGAERYEVACVPALREVSCGGGNTRARGYCVDHELVVRPWRSPTVLHVGGTIPAYNDPYPDLPVGFCTVECEPSACREALQMQLIPFTPLYGDDAPALAAFRTRAACRAYASSREEERAAAAADVASDGSDERYW